MNKRRYALISIVITALMIYGHVRLYSYEVTTHAGITEEMVDLFNLTWGNTITNEKKELMIQGSRDEDNVRRYLNHFYDPVRGIGLYNHYSAKEWATSSVIQKHDFVGAGWGDQDYSWPRIIQDYAEGNENRAWYGLGHILHLIEDMSVPDHTRNDMHAGHHLPQEITGVSPYEDWAFAKDQVSMNGTAETFFARGVQPLLLPDLGAYFDVLANYSNRNFFSANTIMGDERSNYAYADPKIIEFDTKYGYGRDSISGKKFKVIRIKEDKTITSGTAFELTNGHDFSVLEEYFSRLSKQTIISGAGVINLFIREGNRAREVYQKEQDEKIRQAEEEYQVLKSAGILKRFSYSVLYVIRDYGIKPTRKTVVAVWNGTRYSTGVITQAVGSGTSFLASISRNVARLGVITAREKTIEAIDVANNVINDISAKSTTYIQNITQSVSQDQQIGNRNKNNAVSLRNLESQIALLQEEIDMVWRAREAEQSGMQTEHGAEMLTPPPTLLPSPSPTPPPGIIDPHSFSGQFSNSPPEPQPNRAPEPVPNRAPEPAPHSAETTTPSLSPEPEETIQASPSPSETSEPPSSPEPSPSLAPSPDSGDEVTASPSPSPTEEPSPSPEPSLSPEPSPDPEFFARDVVINEIAWMGTRKENSQDEWIELYNTTDRTIDLTEWNIESPGGVRIAFTKEYQNEVPTAPWSETHVSIIPPFGYFLIERTDDNTTSETANWFFKGNLPNADPKKSAEERAAKEGLVLTYQDREIDSVRRWYAGTTDDGYRTMERISAFEEGDNFENWNDNDGVIINGMSSGSDAHPPTPILGTPRKENSAFPPPAV